MDLMEEVRKELASIRSDVTDLKVSDAKQTVVLESVEKNLSEHMRRTDLLEKFTAKWAGVWTGLGVIATLFGIGASIAKIFGGP